MQTLSWANQCSFSRIPVYTDKNILHNTHPPNWEEGVVFVITCVLPSFESKSTLQTS